MGLHDRPYASSETYGESRPPLSMIVKIIIVTAVTFFVDIFTQGFSGEQGVGLLTEYGSLFPDWFMRPWEAFTLVSYGFLHAGIWHILFNMFGLWMIGRLLEYSVGQREFLSFYLVAVVVSGLIWSAVAYTGHLVAKQPLIPVIGASGAVSAVVVATILRYPKETIYLFGIIAMPFWLFGVIFVGMDALQAVGSRDSNVAYTAHLGGAAFAALYHFSGIRFENFLQPEKLQRFFKRKPKLKVVRSSEPDSMEREADRLLQKIHEQGQDSLTAREQRLLEKYSRKVNQRRRSDFDD